MTEKNITVSTETAESQLEIARRLKPFIRNCIDLHHDLNNPLAGILGYAEFILSDTDKLSENIVKDLQQIVNCAEKIRAILEGVAKSKAEVLEGITPETLREYLKED